MIAMLLLAFQTAAAAERVPIQGQNEDMDVYGPTIDSAQRVMIYTLRANRRGSENLVMSTWSGREWSAPAQLPFSGQGLDKEPYLSPDGRRLFFASRRMYDGKDTSGTGEARYDLFVAERRGSSWGPPEPVAGVNSPRYDNYPAAARNGNLYFASHRANGRNDLFVAVLRGSGYQVPEPIALLNTPNTDADPFIAPDESYIIFSSDRPGGLGAGDLYISFNRGTEWSDPVSLGPLVNSADYEYTPWVTADGRWLYFSRGWGEIWRIETRHLPTIGAPR